METDAFNIYERGLNSLSHFDTIVASEHFKTAADLFFKAGRAKSCKDDISFYNAAICYYLAGLYKQAHGTVKNVDFRKLTTEQAKILNDLNSIAFNRTFDSYGDTVRGDFLDMKKRGLHKSILELLRDNPYCIAADERARAMRDACKALGHDKVAELIDKDLQSMMPSRDYLPDF